MCEFMLLSMFIYNSNDGNPRLCLDSAKQCIKQGWSSNATRINLNFLQNHPFCVRGMIDGDEIKIHLLLERRINNDKNILEAYNKLGSLFKQNKELSIILIDDVTHVYNNYMKAYSHRNISNFKLLLSSRIIVIKEDKKSKKIQLDPQIRKLLDIVYEEFEGNDKRVRNFIIHQFGI